MRTHTDDRPFRCTHPGCDKAFFRDTHLKTHVLSHSTIKPLTCTICEKGFNTNQHLKRHVKTHFPSHKCHYEGCLEAFGRRSQLRRHISEIHTKSKLFKCSHETCGKEFNHRSRLDVHVAKVHSHIPTYHCGYDNCSKTFNVWSALQNHIRSQHRKTPCGICGKPCFGPVAAALHMLEHKDGGLREWRCREVECEEPPKSSKQELESHYLQVHGYIPNKITPSIQHSLAKAIGTHDGSTPASTNDGTYSENAGLPESKDISTPSIKSMMSVISLNSPIMQYPYPHTTPQPRKATSSQSNIISKITGSSYSEPVRKFLCPYCSSKYIREYDLQRHISSQHEKATHGSSSAVHVPSFHNHESEAHLENGVFSFESLSQPTTLGFQTISLDHLSADTVDPLVLNA